MQSGQFFDSVFGKRALRLLSEHAGWEGWLAPLETLRVRLAMPIGLYDFAQLTKDWWNGCRHSMKLWAIL